MYGMMPQVNPNLFIGNTIPNALNAMADWRTRQIGNQYLPQQLANQNALTSQQVKYNPGMFQARNALMNQLAQQGTIKTQYLPEMQQTLINQQALSPIAQIMQAQAMAAYRNQLVNYDQARVMNALKGAPMVDSNGNPVGQTTAQQQVVNNLNNPQGGFNINSLRSLMPYPNAAGTAMNTLSGMTSPMAQQQQPAPMPQPQGQMPMQQQVPSTPMPQQAAYIKNQITGNYVSPNGMQIMPATTANKSAAQLRAASETEASGLGNAINSEAQPYNSLLGQYIEKPLAEGAYALGLSPNQTKQNLINQQAAYQNAFDSVSANIRQTTGSKPTQGEIEAQLKVQYPYLSPVNLLSADDRTKASQLAMQQRNIATNSVVQSAGTGYPIQSQGAPSNQSITQPTLSLQAITANAQKHGIPLNAYLTYLKSQGYSIGS